MQRLKPTYLKRKTVIPFFRVSGRLYALLICMFSGFFTACLLFAIFGLMMWNTFWYMVGTAAIVLSLFLLPSRKKL